MNRSPRDERRNLAGSSLSSCLVRQSLSYFVLAFCSVLALAPHVEAQLPDTGYELALSGPATVRADRDARLRGTAYRVRGLATLLPYAGRVRARLRTETTSGAWIEVASGRDGRFELRVPIGSAGEATDAHFEIEVGPEGSARSFEIPIGVRGPWSVVLTSDRNLYEPGEPVHVWALVRDAASGAPARDRTVRLELTGPSFAARSDEVRTDASGVAHLALTLDESAAAGSTQVSATIDGTEASTSFRVGRRTWERLFAHVDLEPEEVAPGASTTAIVRVTSADATPIRDAVVEVSVGEGTSVRGVTSATGEARIQVSAPAYLAGDTGFATVRAHVTHPAYGSVDVRRAMRVAVPLSISLELVPAHGALVPEIDDVVLVRLSDPLDHPPPVGTRIELTGPALRSGRAEAPTDANGIAAFPVRLPRGASSGAEEGAPHTTIRARVTGTALELTSRVSVPVQLLPEVVPTLAHPLAEPGDVIEVRLARRPSAQRSAVVVELLAMGTRELLDLAYAAPGASSVHVTVPRDRIGRLQVRARAVHEDESLEGVGASDTLLVRPPSPDFVSLTPVRERWRVGETARVELHTRSSGSRAWGALLVRDLAAHGGESDFATYFLERAFEEALLEPRGEEGERLLRAALAAAAPIDTAQPTTGPVVDALGLPMARDGLDGASSERDVLRDPWPLARQLERLHVGAPMSELESMLAEALAGGGLDEITLGRGSARRFRDDLLDDSEHVSLGEGPITPAMIEASDPSFSYENVARRVARVRLLALLRALALYLDPGDDASVAARAAAREPYERWLPRMIERGMIDENALLDPWGGRFALHPSTHPALVLSTHATLLELSSPGPDGRIGTADDVRDPFARAVPAGTPYAQASGEDALMEELAVLSPVQRTLEALRAAYARVSAEMTEDEIGDAVHASVSEGTIGLGSIGTIGHGGGGGGEGSGYGSGSGGFRGRSTPTLTVRAGGGNLARVVRERFPPTIVFRPSFEVDASGTTSLEIPLADAVTSYRVEVVVWREDGWIWSARTEISSDREIVIDAPIPTVARVGDRLSIPLRVQNHGTEPRELSVSLLGDEAIGIDDTEPTRVVVPPGGAQAIVVTLAPTRRGDGSLRVVATDPNGVALDAVRRSLSVISPYRRARLEADVLVDGEGRLALDVPEATEPLTGTVRVLAGTGLFGTPGASTWTSWSGPDTTSEGLADTRRGLTSARAADIAFALGAVYARDWYQDSSLQRVEERLARALDAPGTESLADRSWALLGLAPAARALDARPVLAQDTQRLVQRLVRDVADGSAGIGEEPEQLALSAAALGWSGDATTQSRVAELVRRVTPSLVQVGEDVWLATEAHPLRATLLLAMAELSLGHRARAFAFLATVARFRALGRTLAPDEAGLARALASRLAEGTPASRVTLTLAGETHDVPVEETASTLDLLALAAPGSHSLDIQADGTQPVRVTASARYGVPWDRAPERAGPFALALEGTTGAADEIAQLTLVVRNRSPRWITSPVVEVELPTGAELPEDQHAEIRRRVRRSDLEGSTLTLSLRSLAPGAEVRVPLPVRWSIAGTLAGIGVSAYASDAPEAVSVRPPEPLVIAGGAR